MLAKCMFIPARLGTYTGGRAYPSPFTGSLAMNASMDAVPTSDGKPQAIEADALLSKVRDVVCELHPHMRDRVQVSLDSTLDRDLGLDSLARVELLVRLEQSFGVTLSEATLASVETPRDVLRALLAGKPGVGADRRGHSGEVRRSLGEIPAPTAMPETLLEALDWHVRAHPDTHPRAAVRGRGRATQNISVTATCSTALVLSPPACDDWTFTRGAVCRHHAAHRRRVPAQLHGNSAGRRYSGTHISARAAVPDRGSFSSPCAHSGKRRRRMPDYLRAGEAGVASAHISRAGDCARIVTVPELERRRTAGRGQRGICRIRWRFFSTPREAPATPKVWCSHMRDLLASLRSMGEALAKRGSSGRFRELVAPLPRHGAHRRLAWQLSARLSPGVDVAADFSRTSRSAG